ncbi:carbohydrate binding protein [Sinobacterium caligoides]|uniref:Carbohydrate binding protein n=1 Tax=Sinobacterium caligoides TaxID=933926 RepID=A0A3N2DZ99_9GAMM|nr:LamG-like jellyroll fold domain-containing protein [Sinobacterium caligoides]ROS05144.1 carbohydrate binding protein [Sinobacterium caligoides]
MIIKQPNKSYCLDGSDNDLTIVSVEDICFSHCASLKAGRLLSFASESMRGINKKKFTSTVWVKRAVDDSSFSFIEEAGFSCDKMGGLKLMWRSLDSVAALPVGVWSHLTLVKCEDFAQLYVNGELVESLNFPVKWSAEAGYSVGDVVSFGDAFYRASWGTQGQSPNNPGRLESYPWSEIDDEPMMKWLRDEGDVFNTYGYQCMAGEGLFYRQNFYAEALTQQEVFKDYLTGAIRSYALNGEGGASGGAVVDDERFTHCVSLPKTKTLNFGTAASNGISTDSFSATVWVKRNEEGACFSFLEGSGFSCDVSGRLSLLWRSLDHVGVLPVGVWYHLGLVRGRTEVSLYIDGKQADTIRLPSLWSASVSYDVADLVVLNGALYRAKWWTEGVSPEDVAVANYPWQLITDEQFSSWHDKSITDYETLSYQATGGGVSFAMQNFYPAALNAQDVYADFYINAEHLKINLAIA